MMSLTGNTRNEKGITLVEVLLSVVIFVIGIAACYRPLLASLDVLRYGEERISANYALSEAQWKLNERILRGEKLKEGLDTTSIVVEPFRYRVDQIVKHEAEDGRLISVKLRASWSHVNRPKAIQGEALFVIPDRESKIA